jgi:hypothetical protein
MPKRYQIDLIMSINKSDPISTPSLKNFGVEKLDQFNIMEAIRPEF